MSKMFTEMLPKTAGHPSDALSSAMANMGLWEEAHARLLKELKQFSPAALEVALAAAKKYQRKLDNGKSGKRTKAKRA